MRGILGLLLALSLWGQTVNLRGVITDDSGAVVPGALITLTPSTGQPLQLKTDSAGSYQFLSLLAADYTVNVTAPGLALSRPVRVKLRGASEVLNLRLKLTTVTEQVTVEVEALGSTVAVDPSMNATATVLKGEDLDALADDPTTLQEDLMALAGPGAGPNGGQIFVDGFSGGQIPSKDSIREIRINSNPFSPEYDKLGMGRIEIFTKPGTDTLKGSLFYNISNDAWNTRNPYAATKAPFSLHEFGGNLGGSIGKKLSYRLDVRRDMVDNGAILNGVRLDSALQPISYSDVYNVKQRTWYVIPRIDYQLDSRNTLTVRYLDNHITIPAVGVGGFNLAERAYYQNIYTRLVQISETAILGRSVVNDARLQLIWAGYDYDALKQGPAINVSGAFNAGGSNVVKGLDRLLQYEFNDGVSIARGLHTIRLGGRLRGSDEDSTSRQNFNGTFLFNGTVGPLLNASNQPQRNAAGQILTGNITSIEQYRRTLLFQSQGLSPAQIRTLGGGASQFTLNAGNPNLNLQQTDVSLFFGDDWRLRPNLTLSYGLRYETQTNISDRQDWAPRFGIAWGPGGKNGQRPKTVLRFGSGLFYDRFAKESVLLARRYNGVLQQQYVVANPDFYPNVPAVSALSASQPIVQQIDPSMVAQYIIQTAFSVERQLPRNTTLAATYANSHGLHILRSRNINAPLDTARTLFPFPGRGPIYQMESSGLYNQHQLIINSSSRLNKKISLTSSYMLNQARSNTDGVGTFPANQYNLAGEYGPAATDIRHRATVTGAIATYWDLRLSPLLVWQSGMPYNITTGQDLTGSTIFNSRPGLATDPTRPGLVSTPYGLLDPNPIAGETILGRNSGRGPGMLRLNLRVSKTIGVGSRKEAPTGLANAGPSSGSGNANRGANTGVFSQATTTATAAAIPRRYNMVISATLENLPNRNNPGPIIGSITSPLFGRANQPFGSRDTGGGGLNESANNRKIELQLRFNF